MVEAFRHYLVDQRGLVASTSRWDCAVAREFVATIEVHGKVAPFVLTVQGTDVNQFLQGKARARGVGAVHNVTVALGSFFRFVFLVGWIPPPLAGTILPAPGWRDSAPLPAHPPVR